MAGKGHWLVQVIMRNCGSPNCQQGCTEGPQNRPHGPYTRLRRRNPVHSNEQDEVYLGRIELSEEQLDLINDGFSGEEIPTKEEVFALLGL